MGCGCGKKAEKTVYKITDDPTGKKYLTEYEAKQARTTQGLTGEVVAVQG